MQPPTPDTADIAHPATAVKRRGRRPTGIVKTNVCVRLTDENTRYLEGLSGGSKSTAVDALIELHRLGALSPDESSPTPPPASPREGG